MSVSGITRYNRDLLFSREEEEIEELLKKRG